MKTQVSFNLQGRTIQEFFLETNSQMRVPGRAEQVRIHGAWYSVMIVRSEFSESDGKPVQYIDVELERV